MSKGIPSNIPVIDVFAGPGGLSEGFSASYNEKCRFRVGLSIEKEKYAHETLKLRAFYRQFLPDNPPKEYYDFIKGKICQNTLYKQYPQETEAAAREAVNAELGHRPEKDINRLINKTIHGHKSWVLIGGPPCQAYSIAGRSRNKGNKNYIPEKDKRHFLYREYLRILTEYNPPVFIMENVKGLLSSKVNGSRLFDKILEDIKSPHKVTKKRLNSENFNYHIYSLTKPTVPSISNDNTIDPKDFIIESEKYGVPQARHRLIILGVREDYNGMSVKNIEPKPKTSVKSVIDDLPRLRSGLSKKDSDNAWLNSINEISNAEWLRKLDNPIKDKIYNHLEKLSMPNKKRGSSFIPAKNEPGKLKDWLYDSSLGGVCNHNTRGHMKKDLHRYFFAACFTKITKRSPSLSDFPPELHPEHKNIHKALKNSNYFSDRFRVQVAHKPATTITSHISKDGHYYIHYDPTQCRSLTVREAARLQTFPDNYFFCGPRTAQYHQVGNAVPPFLAKQIADIVLDILSNTDD